MARSKPPSFDFYPEDFLAGTMHLHPTCIGIYIRLLCFQWSHGAVSLDDKRQLMQITGAMPDELDEHLPQVRDKFDRYEDGLYRNARLERERERKEGFRAKQSANGSKGGRPKKNATDNGLPAVSASTSDETKPKNNPPLSFGLSNEKPKEKPPSGKLEVGSEEVKKEKKNAVDKLDKLGEWVVPEHLDSPEVRELLAEFEVMRREILKRPITDRKNSSRRFKKFRDRQHLIDTLEACIAEHWQGIDPTYIKPDPLGLGLNSTHANRRVQASAQAIEDFANG